MVDLESIEDHNRFLLYATGQITYQQYTNPKEHPIKDNMNVDNEGNGEGSPPAKRPLTEAQIQRKARRARRWKQRRKERRGMEALMFQSLATAAEFFAVAEMRLDNKKGILPLPHPKYKLTQHKHDVVPPFWFPEVLALYQ